MERKVKLCVYPRHYAGEGGLPFGSVWAFRVELIDLADTSKTISRYASSAQKLKEVVEKSGHPVGERMSLRPSGNYSSESYAQEFILPDRISLGQLDKEIEPIDVL